MQHEREGASPRWLGGSIRRKLTLFVVLLLMMVVGLFWSVSVYLLEPAYLGTITRELSSMLDTMTGILNKAAAEGPIITTEVRMNGTVKHRLSDACLAMIAEAEESGTLDASGRCLEVADANMQSLYVDEGMFANCMMHPSVELGVSQGEVWMDIERNGSVALLVRGEVLARGSYEQKLSYSENENGGQYVMGRTAADGSVTVVVSANIERIPQAVNVLKGLLYPATLVLILAAIFAVWIFSHWFTRPVSRLSAAAKEMARGNYDVRVAEYGGDEISDLAHDFNVMADEVQRSAELQRDLIANVSHDLRTPLTLIKGYAETVRDLTGDDPEKRTEQLNVIVDESDRLSALVGSVMELSRVSSGNEKAELVRFDIGQLCDEVAYRYEAVCAQQGYHFDLHAEEGCEIYADPALVERALHNLLGNALNHVGADGHIGLRAFRTGQGTVRVEVSDHGPGIAEADMPHLFDRYYRSRADTGKPGTGLGLSITKAIFVAHGFLYGVQSALGHGATFWFECPLAEQ